MLPLNLSDTATTSQDGSSLEFLAPVVGRQWLYLGRKWQRAVIKSLMVCGNIFTKPSFPNPQN